MTRPDHILLNKPTRQHMRSDDSCVAEYYSCKLCMGTVSYVSSHFLRVLHSLNEFIKFFKEVGLHPSYFVHPRRIHL